MQTFPQLADGALVVVRGKVEEGSNLDMGVEGTRIELGNVTRSMLC